jgi:hypothetical protein
LELAIGASDAGTVVLSKYATDALLQGWTMLSCDLWKPQLEPAIGASDAGTVVLSKYAPDALLQGWTMLGCDLCKQQ